MKQILKEFLWGMSLVCIGNGIKYNSYKQYLGEKFNKNIVNLGVCSFFLLLLGAYTFGINAFSSHSFFNFICSIMIIIVITFFPAKILKINTGN